MRNAFCKRQLQSLSQSLTRESRPGKSGVVLALLEVITCNNIFIFPVNPHGMMSRTFVLLRAVITKKRRAFWLRKTRRSDRAEESFSITRISSNSDKF